MRRFTRYFAGGTAAILVGGMLTVLVAATPAFAVNSVTFAVAHADIYDSGYNQSSTSVLTATETGGGTPGIPYIVSATPGTGFTCGAPTTQTATTASCTIEAAPGDGDDSGVVGAAGTTNTLVFGDTDSTSTNYTSSNTPMIIYPAPICGASGTNPFNGLPGTAGAQIAPDDTTYGSPAVAEACYNGASGPASTLLTNVSASGGTIFTGSNPTDAAGGLALTIMAGPGFNWTGAVGSGEQDVDTGTAGLSGQAWTLALPTADPTVPVTLVTVTSGSPTLTVSSSFPAGVVGGMTVSGTDIPATPATTVSTVGGNTLTMSANANITTATTVAAGSNGQNIASLTGANLDVASVTGFSASGGQATVATSAGTATISYTGDSSTAPAHLSGVSLVSGSGTVSTGGAVNETAIVETVTFGFYPSVSSGSPTVTVGGGGFPGVTSGMSVSGTDVAAGTTVSSVGGNSLTMSAPASASDGTDTLTFGASTAAPPPSSFLTSTSTVASEASFKSSGDPLNTCPPLPAMIDAGASFCDEEFETSGAGPSAGEVALDYAGQGDPTSTTPTVSLSSGSGAIGGSVEMTDASGACPSTIGTGTTGGNFFNGSYDCWYGRAGDPSPVTVTVGGVPAAVAPTSPATSDVSEADYSVDGPSDSATYDGAGTVTLMNVSGGSNMVSCSATSAGTATAPYGDLLGDGVSGTDIPVGTEVTAVNNAGSGSCSLTLSNSATATPAAETLTFSAVTLNPPQLNATFTIAPGTPTGSQPVEVCEATTPDNGNDWEFGVQWLSPNGSLSYASGNSGPTQVCGSTTIDVTAASSSTTSSPASSSIALGQSDTDSATVTGSDEDTDPTGSVTFYECGPTASPQPCTSGSWTQLDTEALSGASNPDTVTSTPFSPDSAGQWCFAAVYSGDSNYSGSQDSTTDECFDAGSSETTSMPTGSSIALGQTNTDTATVTGSDASIDPTGTVDFYECGPTSNMDLPCTYSGMPFDTEVLGGSSNPGQVTSAAFQPTSVGYWCFAAVYTGDSNYSASSDNTSDECFDVAPALSTTTSTPSRSRVVINSQITDSARVTGNSDDGAPTGSVTFYVCGPTGSATPCTSLANEESLARLSPVAGQDYSTAVSTTFKPTTTGYWCFGARYGGDTSYGSSADTSVGECVDVVPHKPSITSFNPASGPVGTVVKVKGKNLSGATVTIDGKAATVRSDTATLIKVVVPAGAHTGSIVVTTAGGTATSGTNFKVT
jgi:IPT/TIG domain